ncbi:hypothetical protein RvY_01969 [Ramazzottius varieornatus]|uniref:NADH dehydrogenase [ubiquinone] 1 subunit C2 n=1 Tax=Ramazzottius varieornatus TaxID=947166 RepID=A0A1D1UTB4_RAMVA|nr:hypothetical protein RvY_01969 [Ramazzottius varieornatus]
MSSPAEAHVRRKTNYWPDFDEQVARNLPPLESSNSPFSRSDDRSYDTSSASSAARSSTSGEARSDAARATAASAAGEHRGSTSGGLGSGASGEASGKGTSGGRRSSWFGGKSSGVAGETRSDTAQHAGSRGASGEHQSSSSGGSGSGTSGQAGGNRGSASAGFFGLGSGTSGQAGGGRGGASNDTHHGSASNDTHHGGASNDARHGGASGEQRSGSSDGFFSKAAAAALGGAGGAGGYRSGASGEHHGEAGQHRKGAFGDVHSVASGEYGDEDRDVYRPYFLRREMPQPFPQDKTTWYAKYFKQGRTDDFYPFWGAVGGYLCVVFGNYRIGHPVFSRIYLHAGGALLGWWLGGQIDYYQSKSYAERDAMMRHYMSLHPEDFQEQRPPKLKYVIYPWYPVRETYEGLKNYPFK